MAGQSDLQFTTALDLTGATRDIANFAKNVPAIKLKLDTQPLGSFSRQASEFQKSLAASQSRVLAFSLTASQVFGVTRAFQALLKSTIDVEKQLKDINVILGLSNNQLKQFSGQLFKVASETGNSFKVAAQGAVELSRQGLSAVETLKRLKDALTLTRLSGLSVEDSISAITTAINSFNDATLDSTAIINKLANVDAQFAVSSKDLADALSRVGSTAKDTRVSFDELLGVVTAARQITGREGAVIGNALKTIFQRIERPEVLDNLRELGVAVEDYSGKTLSARVILENLGKTYDKLSQSQKNQVVQLAAGVFQANQFRAILSDLAKQNSITARATDAASNASDQAARRQADLNKTLSANINETLNNLTEFAAKVGNITLEPFVRKITSYVGEVTSSLGEVGGKNSEEAGIRIGEGVLKGIGNYLSGPGLALGGILLGKLFLSFASYTKASLTQLLEVGSGKYQQEQAITQLLQQRPALEAEIARMEGNQAGIQKLITQELIKQNALLNQRATITTAIASNVTSSGALGQLFFGQKALIRNDETLLLNPKRPKAAAGFIPTVQEKMGAYAGGYTPGEVKQTNIPRLGNVYYNTAETIKKFPQFVQPAILPPKTSKAGLNYEKQFIRAHGFNPYKSEGMIPNYAWTHNTNVPLDLSRLKDIKQTPGSKPRGLWVAKDNQWLDWVRDNMPEWERKKLYELELNDKNILHLSSEDDIINFGKQYRDTSSERAKLFRARGLNLGQIDWNKVAKNHAGITMPYYPSLAGFGADENMWHYGWDVDSGAIWRPEGIKGYKEIPKFFSGFSPYANKGMIPNFSGERYLGASQAPINVRGVGGQLSNIEKRVLFASKAHGMDNGEIARTIGIPVQSVQTILDNSVKKFSLLYGQAKRGKLDYNEGLIPNYARLLGSGAYGQFFDLEKRFKGVDIGLKKFYGKEDGRKNAAEEFVINDFLHKNVSLQGISFPKVFGSALGSYNSKSIVKELLHGFSFETMKGDDYKKFGLDTYKAYEAANDFAESLREHIDSSKLVRASDVHTGNFFVSHAGKDAILDAKSKNMNIFKEFLDSGGQAKVFDVGMFKLLNKDVFKQYGVNSMGFPLSQLGEDGLKIHSGLVPNFAGIPYRDLLSFLQSAAKTNQFFSLKFQKADGSIRNTPRAGFFGGNAKFERRRGAKGEFFGTKVPFDKKRMPFIDMDLYDQFVSQGLAPDEAKQKAYRTASFGNILQVNGEDVLRSKGLVPNYARNIDIFRGLKFYTDSFTPDIEKLRKPAESGHGFIGNASGLLNTLLYSITNMTKPGIIPFSLSRKVAEQQFAKGNASGEALIGKSGFLIKSSIPVDNILRTKSQINDLLDAANKLNRQERGLNIDSQYNSANTFDGISRMGNFSVSQGLLFDEAKKLVGNRQSYVSLTDLRDYLREEKEIPLIGNKINNANIERLYSKGLIPNYARGLNIGSLFDLGGDVNERLLESISGYGKDNVSDFRKGLLNVKSGRIFDNYQKILPGEYKKYLKFIETPEIQELLKDNKIVNIGGKPLPFFHFTNRDKFEADKTGPSRHSYFGTDLGSLSSIQPRSNLFSGLLRGDLLSIGPQFNKSSGSSFYQNSPILEKALTQKPNSIILGNYKWASLIEALTDARNFLQYSKIKTLTSTHFYNRAIYGETRPNGFNGLVPNFNSLSSAILRENKAGIPISQIRVGTSPRLNSSLNPMGLGVYNTKDEPGGLNQGISRIASMGLNPKTAGIPNYADTFGGTFGISQEGQLPLYVVKDLNQKINNYKAFISSGLANQETLNKATVSLANQFNLTKEAMATVAETFKASVPKNRLALPATSIGQSQRFAEALTKVDAGLERANKLTSGRILGNFQYQSPFLDEEGNRRRTISLGAGIESSFEKERIRNQARSFRFTEIGGRTYRSGFNTVEEDLIGIKKDTEQQILARQKKEQEQRVFIQKNTLPLSPGTFGPSREQFDYQNSLKRFARQEELSRQRPFNSLSRLSQSSYLSGTQKEFLDNLKGISQISRGLPEELRQQFQTQLREFARQGVREFKTQDFFNRANKASLLNPFSYARLEREAKNTGQLGVFEQTRQRLQGRALNASFILPVAGGILEQGIGSQFGESRTGRGIARLAGGATNIASFAATGFGIAGPYGALGGAALGIGSELPTIIKAFKDTLPDLQRSLEKLTESSQRVSTSFNSFIQTSQQLSSIRRGESSATVGQEKNIERERLKALSGIPLEARGRITEAENKGDLAEVARIASNYVNREEQKRLFTGDLASLVSRSGQRNTGGTFDEIKRRAIAGYQSGQVFNEGSDLENGRASLFGSFSNATFGLTKGLFANSPLRSLGIYGDTGQSTIDVENLKKRFETLNEVRPFLEGLTTLADKEGNTLSDLITPKDLEALRKASQGGAANKDIFADKFGQVLNRTGIGSGSEYAEKIKLADPKTIESLLELFPKIFDSKRFEREKADRQKRIVAAEQFNLALDSINKKLIDLSLTGRKAANDFEIGVLGRLIKGLTGIEIGGINRRGLSERQLTESGNNNYLRNFIELSEKQASARDTFQGSNLQAQSAFSSNAANLITTAAVKIPKDILEEIRSNPLYKNSEEEVNKLFYKRTGSLSNIFGGVANVNLQSGNTSLLQDNLSKENIQTIIDRARNEVEKLDFEAQGKGPIQEVIGLLKSTGANRLGDVFGSEDLDLIKGISNKGFREQLLSSNTEQLQDTLRSKKQAELLKENFQNITASFQELLLNLDKQTAEIINNLESTNEKAAAEFRNNKQLFGTQFSVFQTGLNYQTGLDTGLTRFQGNQGRNRLIANPFEQLSIDAQTRNRVSGIGILSGLQNSIPGLQLNNPEDIGSVLKQKEGQLKNLRKFEDNTSNTAKLEGEIEKLREAQAKYNAELEKTSAELEEQKKNLQLQLNFTQNKVEFTSQRNRNLAASGDFGQLNSRENLVRTLVEPLQQTPNDFWDEMSSNLQSFSIDFKQSFKDGFREALTGAETFGEAMRKAGLNIATNILGKSSDLAINTVFGSLFNQISTPKGRANGGLIHRFAKGGYVNIGSGVKDDVPAFLSGGEFVLNKKATRKIGKHNLDVINSVGATSDTISGGPNSSEFTLANSFNLTDGGRKGEFNVSPLLSAFALTDENNPQNRIKFAREQYVFERNQFDKQVKKAREDFEKKQMSALIGAYVTAGIGIGGAYFQNRGSNNSIGGQTQKEFYNAAGQEPATFGAPGGKRYAAGGYFGGDSSSDRYRAQVMKGEYIFSPQTVSKHGVNYFNNLNKSYAAGGYVNNSPDDSNTFDRLVSVNEEIRDLLIKNNSSNNRQTSPQNSNGYGAITVNMPLTISISKDGASVSESKQADVKSDNGVSPNDKDGAIKLQQALKNKVVEVVDQMARPGGSLFERFQTRR